MLNGQGLRGPILLPEHHEDLGFDHSARGVPLRICPVIMPGRETVSLAPRELMTADAPFRSLLRGETERLGWKALVRILRAASVRAE